MDHKQIIWITKLWITKLWITKLWITKQGGSQQETMRNGKKRVPPQGDEQSVKSPGKTLGKSNGGNAGGNIPSDLAELMAKWPSLSQDIRKQCLELARAQTAPRSNVDA
jgi:hypothetical protein